MRGTMLYGPRDVRFEELPDAFATLLGGQARGRFVVDLSDA